MQYFIHDGKLQQGPFTAEQLTKKSISGHTMVWRQGMPAWSEALSLPELKDVIVHRPPPFKKSRFVNIDLLKNIDGRIHNKSGKVIFRTIWITLSLIGVTAIYHAYSDWPHLVQRATKQQLDSLIVKQDDEKVFPTRTVGLIGTLVNTSKVYSYKDFVFKVWFYSESGGALGSKVYIANDDYDDVFPCGVCLVEKMVYRDAPKGSHSMRWKLIDATPYFDDGKHSASFFKNP